jgi:hypothetical protein
MTLAASPQEISVATGKLSARLAALINRSRIASVGGVTLILLALSSFLLPALSPYDPLAPSPLEIFQAPSARHWFGTDINGMDVFTRVLYGARYSFMIAVPTVVIAVLRGAPIGLYAGYRGGLIDELLTRFTDTLRIFPGIVLALAIVAALGPSIVNVVLTLAILDAAIFARLVRAETIAVRKGGIVESAVAVGNPDWRGDVASRLSERAAGHDSADFRTRGLGRASERHAGVFGNRSSAADAGMGPDDPPGRRIHAVGPMVGWPLPWSCFAGNGPGSEFFG